MREDYESIEVPESWYIGWPSNFSHGTKKHLVQIIKDGDVEIVVCKAWNEVKQCWVYGCDTKWSLQYSIAAWDYIQSQKDSTN